MNDFFCDFAVTYTGAEGELRRRATDQSEAVAEGDGRRRLLAGDVADVVTPS